jgi:ubiquinone/menaquinone biosynthesis C-methylase UbiE
LLPRLWPFLPTGTICEIAPGYGRWTQYLLRECDQYVGVDLASRCVEACRERFSTADHARFEVNDGRSLPMLQDDSVDFVFSFDSLVHVEADVIAKYLVELARVLRRDGIAWLHHSNLGEFSLQARRTAQAEAVAFRSPTLRSWLRKYGVIEWRHSRGVSMTAPRFVNLATQAQLTCVGQEIVNWGGARLIDCISLVTHPGSVWDRPNEVRRNPNFMDEGTSARSISAVFTSMSDQRRRA